VALSQAANSSKPTPPLSHCSCWCRLCERRLWPGTAAKIEHVDSAAASCKQISETLNLRQGSHGRLGGLFWNCCAGKAEWGNKRRAARDPTDTNIMQRPADTRRKAQRTRHLAVGRAVRLQSTVAPGHERWTAYDMLTAGRVSKRVDRQSRPARSLLGPSGRRNAPVEHPNQPNGEVGQASRACGLLSIPYKSSLNHSLTILPHCLFDT
jgi:hypothetical protein